MPPTVSFTVRRPTPTSRPSSSGPESDGPFKVPALPRHLVSAGSSAAGSPLAGSPRTFSSRDDSDDDEDTGIVFSNPSGLESHSDSSDEEEFIASDQRSRKEKKRAFDPEKPLVIPSQPNPDWREAARRRRAACSRVRPSTSRITPSFVPDSAFSTTGADGSVGGLGTKDTINSGPQLSGLQIRAEPGIEDPAVMEAVSNVSADLSEADALKQDVQELPDVATADDYERVPISAFGAAMLRGMGWTDGVVASKTDKKRKNGLTELYIPQARPALLGIGAKEQESGDDESGKKKPKGKDMRYIPVARKEGERGENESSRSGTVSRRSSRSPSRRSKRDDRVPNRERGAYNDRERRKERDRDQADDRRWRSKDYDDRVRERRDYQNKDRDRPDRRDRRDDR